MKHMNIVKLAAIVAMFPFTGAFAADGDITATASFRVAIAVTQTTPLAFNAVGPQTEFTGAPDTSEIRVFTDGSRAITGPFFILPGSGNATAGVLAVTGAPAETVNIACDDTAILQHAVTIDTLVLSAIELDLTGGIPGNATDCDVGGVGTPIFASHVIPGSGTFNINVGARIVANSGSGVVNGAYSTANAGGNPVTIRVLYN